MNIKEYIIENKVKIGIAILGLTVAGGLLYWFTRDEKTQEHNQQVIPLTQSKLSLTSTVQNEQNEQQIVEDPYNQNFIKVINQTKNALNRSGDLVNQQVISLIVRGQYTLSNQQIKNSIFKSRKERRSRMKDTLQYANIVTKHQLELQQIQQKYLGAILSRFGIDKVTWSQANRTWQQKTTQQDQGISELIRQEESKQLLSLRNPYGKPKSYQMLQEILLFKINELKKLDINQLGFNIGSDLASKYDIIVTFINDLVYKKFKVQAEDIQYSIEQLEKSLKLKIIQYEDQISQLLNSLIGADDQDEKVSQYN